MQDDPKIKMLVLLGEVGGIEEYTVCDLLKNKRINKPIVAWCIGTCSDVFSTDVQVSLMFVITGQKADLANNTLRAAYTSKVLNSANKINAILFF